jgi:hypothetical protein
LTTFNARVDEKIQKLKIWPRSGRALSNALRRLAPNLAAVGIEVAFSRNSRSRTISIKTNQPPEESRPVRSPKSASASTGNLSSPSSPASLTPQNQELFSDGEGDAQLATHIPSSVTKMAAKSSLMTTVTIVTQKFPHLRMALLSVLNRPKSTGWLPTKMITRKH